MHQQAGESIRKGLACSALSLAIALAVGGVPVNAQAQAAQVSAVQQYTLPAGGLREALNALGAQSGLQIVYRPELVAGRTVGAVSGRYSASEALTRLLAGSDLVWEASGEGTIVLRASAPAAPAPRPAARERRGASADEPVTNLPEILVLGAKSQSVDIRRTKNDPQPYVVFDSEEIQRSAAINLEDFFRQRLPMDAASAPSNLGQTPGGNTSSVNLRGLGFSQTLILVNGRRIAGIALAGSGNQPDLNGIPLAAVERIEVLPTTASGIYGGSATGGVINIILKRDYSGIDLRLTYNNVFEGEAGRKRIDVSGGFSLESGKTTVSLAASHERANPLLARDRGFYADYRAESFRVAPDGYLPPNPPPLGATTNIRSLDGSRLVLDDGTVLDASFTSLPVGYAGPASDGGAALAVRAGQYDFGLANSAQSAGGGNRSMQVGSEVSAFMGSIQREFGSRIRVFVDANYSRNDSFAPLSGANAPFTVAADAPSNPFQQAVQVMVPTNSVDAATETRFTNQRWVGGVIFDLPAQWRGVFDHGRERTESEVLLSGGINTAAVATAIASGALDVFRDTSYYPIDIAPYKLPRDVYSPRGTTLESTTLRLGGPIGRLPGGSPEVAVLLETQESVREEGLSTTSLLNRTQFYPERSQSSRSAYAELRLPLVSARNAKPWVEGLDLQVTGRHDRYTSRGVTGTITWTGGPGDRPASLPLAFATNRIQSTDFTTALRWKVIEDITLRMSYGAGFHPPSVDQLVSTFVPGTVITYIDPLRGNTSTGAIDLIIGGNADLRPESSKSWSAGLILTPRFLSGARLSIDYLDISKTDNIAEAFPGGTQSLINAAAEGRFTERVTRGAPLPGDPAGWAGPIVLVDDTALNIAGARLKAYDVRLDYDLPTDLGGFHFFAAATYTAHARTQSFVGAPESERVGLYGGVLKVKGNLGVTWTRGAWSVGWNAAYFDSYSALPVGSPPGFDELWKLYVQGPNLTIPSQTYHDVNASYRFNDNGTVLAGVELQFGVRNIFNKAPPRVADPIGFSRYGNALLANYWVSLSKHF